MTSFFLLAAHPARRSGIRRGHSSRPSTRLLDGPWCIGCPGPVAAGGYLVVEGDASTLPSLLRFGLGSVDSAVLYAPAGVLVDSHSWTAAIDPASRCPWGDRPVRRADHRDSGRGQRVPLRYIGRA